MEDKKNQRIKKLTIKDVARVIEANIEPPEHGMVEVCGKNAAGKTTVLRSIFAAFGGKVPEVRNGEARGDINVETDDLSISLTITPKKDTIRLIDKKTGDKVRAPKTVLKSFFGKRAFDVFSFLNAKGKEQVDILLNVVKFPFDLDGFKNMLNNRVVIVNPDDRQVTEIINDAYKQLMTERTVVNRKVKTLESLLASYGDISDLYEIDIAPYYELKNKIIKARAKKEEIGKRKQYVDSMKKRVVELLKTVADLEGQIKKEETEIRLAESDVEEAVPYDLEEIEEEIKRGVQNNENYKKNKDKLKKQDELQELSKDSAELTSLIDSIHDYKIKLMKQTDFPIDGLDIKRGQIYYNDSPLIDASGAEQLRVAIAIAHAEMPKDGLQALFVFDPPQIDEETTSILKDFAEEKKIQLWIARVEDDPRNGEIFLHEGRTAK